MNQLCCLVAEILGVGKQMVGPETGPGKLPKWDSFAHIQLIAAVEETYRVSLSTDHISNIISVRDIAKLLREKGISVD